MTDLIGLIGRLDPKSRKAVHVLVAERVRQIEQEGWTAEHDDEHDRCELSMVAVAYIRHVIENHGNDALGVRYDGPLPDGWPGTWDLSWWKPKNPRRDLARAGALLIAEMARLARQKRLGHD